VRICESLWDSFFAKIANPLEYNIYYPAELLVALSARLPPDSAARICESVSERMLAALSDPEFPDVYIASIAISLSAVAKHLEPAACTRICESASAKLLTIFADPERYGHLGIALGGVSAGQRFHAKALAALAERLGPIAASRICESASEKMLAFFDDPKRPYGNLADLAASAVTLSSRMTPVVAARVCDSAATELLANFANSKRQPDELVRLANELAALSAHLPSDAAARVCEPVSIRLLTALDDPASDFSAIAHALVSLTERMQPAAAKSTVLRAIRSLTRDEIISVWFGKKTFDLLESMAMASRHLDPPLRQTLVHHFLVLRFVEHNWGNSLLQSTLSGLQRQEPHYAAMSSASEDTKYFTVPVDQEFLTLKLTTQEVVEFLKSPMKNGPERRAFLDLLECRYGRRFGNQWAFVEYAQAENLALDFTTRVKRPDPKAILKNIHKLIDDELVKP